MDEDVVDAVVHEILAHGVMHAGARGDEDLGPDAVGGEHEDGALVAVRDPHHAAERADRAERELGTRAAHQLRDAALRLVRDAEVDAGGAVAVGHAPLSSSTSKCTRSLNTRTRARTSARVTPASPWMPNFSTAKEPMAAP